MPRPTKASTKASSRSVPQSSLATASVVQPPDLELTEFRAPSARHPTWGTALVPQFTYNVPDIEVHPPDSTAGPATEPLQAHDVQHTAPAVTQQAISSDRAEKKEEKVGAWRQSITLNFEDPSLTILAGGQDRSDDVEARVQGMHIADEDDIGWNPSDWHISSPQREESPAPESMSGMEDDNSQRGEVQQALEDGYPITYSFVDESARAGSISSPTTSSESGLEDKISEIVPMDLNNYHSSEEENVESIRPATDISSTDANATHLGERSPRRPMLSSAQTSNVSRRSRLHRDLRGLGITHPDQCFQGIETGARSTRARQEAAATEAAKERAREEESAALEEQKTDLVSDPMLRELRVANNREYLELLGSARSTRRREQ